MNLVFHQKTTEKKRIKEPGGGGGGELEVEEEVEELEVERHENIWSD